MDPAAGEAVGAALTDIMGLLASNGLGLIELLSGWLAGYGIAWTLL